MSKYPTLEQAKARWKKHTRHVVTDDIRTLAKQSMEWRLSNGTDGLPVLFVGLDGDKAAFGFRFDDRGNVYGYHLG